MTLTAASVEDQLQRLRVAVALTTRHLVHSSWSQSSAAAVLALNNCPIQLHNHTTIHPTIYPSAPPSQQNALMRIGSLMLPRTESHQFWDSSVLTFQSQAAQLWQCSRSVCFCVLTCDVLLLLSKLQDLSSSVGYRQPTSWDVIQQEFIPTMQRFPRICCLSVFISRLDYCNAVMTVHQYRCCSSAVIYVDSL